MSTTGMYNVFLFDQVGISSGLDLFVQLLRTRASFLLWLVFQIAPADCISCYACFTQNPKDNCAISPRWTSEYCQNSFCLKTVINHPNGSLSSLSRTCVDFEMASYCLKGQLEDDMNGGQHRQIDSSKRESNVCTYFCGSNYCNSSDKCCSKSAVTLRPLQFLIGLWLTVRFVILSN